jgi:hypothetical protein
MSMKKFYSLMIISSLLTLNAGLIDGLEGQIQNNVKNSLNSTNIISSSSGKKLLSKVLGVNLDTLFNANIINIPGLVKLGIKCDLDDFNAPNIDICKIIPKGASNSISLNFGICKVSMGLSTQCINELAQYACQNMMSNLKQNIVSPIKTIRSSVQELVVNGDNIINSYKWTGSCDSLFSHNRKKAITNPNGVSLSDIEKFYYRPNIVTKYAFDSVNANSIYDTRLEKWKECIFLNAQNGNYNEALQKCSDIKHGTMPETESEVIDNIIDTSNLLLSGIEDPLIDNYNVIYTIQTNYIQKCSNSDNPINCENNLWENGFQTNNGKKINMKKAYNDKLIKIEKAEARFATVVKKATRKKNGIVFYSESFIRTLPVKEQEKYRFLAIKAMHQQIINNYFLKEITNNEKEIASINYNMQKVASSVFYTKKAIKEINNLVTIFSQSQLSGNK